MYSTLNKLNEAKRSYDTMNGLDIYTHIFETNLSSKHFKSDVEDAMKRYWPISQDNPSLLYSHFDKELLSENTHSFVTLPKLLDIPAYGTDPVDEAQAKFDLVASTLTPLYTSTSHPIQPNMLLFHYTGLSTNPFATGELCPSVHTNKEYFDTCEDTEKQMRLQSKVEESFSLGMNHHTLDPLATILPYKELKKHIHFANDILRSQYAFTMRHESLTNLRDTVISQHGSDSIVSLMLHMESPEKFANAFVPRGFCSSISTGKTSAYRDKSSYQGIVTMQTTGTLNVDVEDGEQHLQDGSVMNIANLYLIFQMNELVPNDFKFNFADVQLKLTSQSIDQLEEEILRETNGKCHLSRDGQLTKTIIQKIATLRVGPYRIQSNSYISSKQLHEFDIVMGSKPTGDRIVVFQKNFE